MIKLPYNVTWVFTLYIVYCKKENPEPIGHFNTMLDKFNTLLDRILNLKHQEIKQLNNHLDYIQLSLGKQLIDIPINTKTENLPSVINQIFSNITIDGLLNQDLQNRSIGQDIEYIINELILLLSSQSLHILNLANPQNSIQELNIMNSLLSIYSMLIRLEKRIDKISDPQREIARKAGKKSGLVRQTINPRLSNLRDFIENLSPAKFINLIQNKQTFFNDLVFEDKRYCEQMGFTINYKDFDANFDKYLKKRLGLDLSGSYCGKIIVPKLYPTIITYVHVNNINLNIISKSWIYKKITIINKL